MMTILKGLPSSYFKDLQDDKELVFKSDELITNSLNILKEVFNNISANKAKMLKSADTGFILSTDLVDYIVKKNNLVKLLNDNIKLLSEVNKSIEIKLNKRDEEILLQCDKEQISRVFINLIKNSIE